MNKTELHTALEIINPHFYTFKTDLLEIDVLGGVDLTVVERMYCTLRISHQDYPSLRHTLDLYNDSHTDQLNRKLCTQFELNIFEVGTLLAQLTRELEDYRLTQMRIYSESKEQVQVTDFAERDAKKLLKSTEALELILEDFNELGIFENKEVVLPLFLSMISAQSTNPVSVLYHTSSSHLDNELLLKLSACLPKGSYTHHTQVSDNALYYFDPQVIDGKSLLIEDLKWTDKMIRPLSALMSQGKISRTRAIKDHNGHLYSTTFNVKAKLSVTACVRSSKKLDAGSLPFITIHQNDGTDNELQLIKYQQQLRAGIIDAFQQKEVRNKLQSLCRQLNKVSIINPYAPLIDMPQGIPNPSNTLNLLLDFIESITYLHQFQRTKKVDEDTGEEFLLIHPKDIETALELLKSSLLKTTDELTNAAGEFLQWLKKTMEEEEKKEFTTWDIRSIKKLHPRSLNRYLKELVSFGYLTRMKGSKYNGYQYSISELVVDDKQEEIDNHFKAVMKSIWVDYEKR